MSWHILPTKLINFAMSVRSRKHAPMIRHCWAVRLLICLIKSNTEKQLCPLTLLTNISNFRARKYHINIESQVPIHAFRLVRLTIVWQDDIWQVNKSSLSLARLPAAQKWCVSARSPCVGHWGGLTRDVHNLWPDTGHVVLEKIIIHLN